MRDGRLEHGRHRLARDELEILDRLTRHEGTQREPDVEEDLLDRAPGVSLQHAANQPVPRTGDRICRSSLDDDVFSTDAKPVV